MEIDFSRQVFVITRGLPGSGKTTWAKKMAAIHDDSEDGPPIVRVNRDEIRLSLGFKFDPKREDEVTQIQNEMFRTALTHRRSVISDDTYLRPQHVEQRREMAERYGVPFIVNDEFLSVPIETCFERDLQRESSVGKDVIEKLYYTYWSYLPKPPNTGKPAIICDLDGTLAIIPKGANFYDRDFTQDILNEPVRDVVVDWNLREDSPHVILLSGRKEFGRAQTEEWLESHFIPYDYLYMRPNGDNRPDTVLKSELYDKFVQGKYRINFVLDDRPSVVRMWRAEKGLTVFQVGPNMEF